MPKSAATKEEHYSIETSVRSVLVGKGIVPSSAEWSALQGGRTNKIWRVQGNETDLVCKLFDPSGGTTLFPNDPAAEVVAVSSLSGTKIAPTFVGEYDTRSGHCLVYEFIEGQQGTDLTAVAQTLASLHKQPPPKGLRKLIAGSEEILATGDAILAQLNDDSTRQLMSLKPPAVPVATTKTVFLHGDFVPANTVQTERGVVLIDWQCPAVGDPCEDIATFLSPAMQELYGAGPLSAVQEAAFLDAYSSPETVQNFRALRPNYLWRMAAHCWWKAKRGDVGYAGALKHELVALERLQN